MSIIGSANAFVARNSRSGYQISRSLRFNSADSAYLNRTPASTTNRRTWTVSCWVKRTRFSTGTEQTIFGSNNGSTFTELNYAASSDVLRLNLAAGTASYYFDTSGVFRDPSAWYHIVAAVDTTQATASDRIKLYINGVQQTGSNNPPTQNYDTQWNVNQGAFIGSRTASTWFGNFYLTEFYNIDGQALTPSSFGETDTITGVWKPKKYSGSGYGTNGFYLNFSDNSSLTTSSNVGIGKDYSGNGNYWVTTGLSVTAGAGNDSLIDTPTPYADGGNNRGNYCTLNPLAKSNGTLSDGNLVFAASGDNASAWSTFAVNTGKWYWEVTKNSGDMALTLAQDPKFNGYQPEGDATGLMCFMYYSSGSSTGNRFRYVSTNYAFPSGFGDDTDGTIYSFTLNFDTGEFKVKRANDSATEATFSMPAALTAKPLHIGYSVTATWPSANFTFNFGQRAFAYTPPSGFLALNTQNLPEPSIKKPSSYFNVELWSGSGTTNARTGLGFSPDLVWVKARGTNANSHYWYDAVRGVTKYLNSDATGAEGTETGGQMTSFDSNGFTVATNDSHINKSGNTYVAWCWDANGAGSSNTAGTITSTVSANATAGFSIVTYTGNGISGATVGHGLGVAPKLVFIKNRSSSTNWDAQVFGTIRMSLNTTEANQGNFLSTFTSTTFSLAGSAITQQNATGDNFVAYCFSEVAGFSKFGSYTGNGSTDGPFLHCGFRPAFVIIKSSSSGYDWFMFDNRRDPENVVDLALFPNSSSAESGGSTYMFDFTANGIKIRNSQLNLNGSGNTYIFCAWAETPFKYALAR
jgi:hypothetical protein